MIAVAIAAALAASPSPDPAAAQARPVLKLIDAAQSGMAPLLKRPPAFPSEVVSYLRLARAQRALVHLAALQDPGGSWVALAGLAQTRAALGYSQMARSFRDWTRMAAPHPFTAYDELADEVVDAALDPFPQLPPAIAAKIPWPGYRQRVVALALLREVGAFARVSGEAPLLEAAMGRAIDRAASRPGVPAAGIAELRAHAARPDAPID